MRKPLAITVALLLVSLLSLTAFAQVTQVPEPAFEGQELLLATTTSTYDSGLLDFILPDFEAQTGATVDVVAVGTGAALELGENGDADVVLVHARTREEAFVEDGYGTQRYDVMYNDFVIIGPADDPAGITSANTAADAFAAIAEAEATFISRGDDSGTNIKELGIWESAEVDPDGDWYLAAGQGMGAVLTIADEQQAYTLTDRATYLARQTEGLELSVLFEGDEALFNPYGVIPVNPGLHPEVNFQLAQAFVDWLTAPATQTLITEFEIEDTQLFFIEQNEDTAAEESGTPTRRPTDPPTEDPSLNNTEGDAAAPAAEPNNS